MRTSCLGRCASIVTSPLRTLTTLPWIPQDSHARSKKQVSNYLSLSLALRDRRPNRKYGPMRKLVVQMQC